MIVDIFIPCFMDQIYPQAGFNMVKVLEKVGCAVNYNPEQTCCGQPAFNAGFFYTQLYSFLHVMRLHTQYQYMTFFPAFFESFYYVPMAFHPETKLYTKALQIEKQYVAREIAVKNKDVVLIEIHIGQCFV